MARTGVSFEAVKQAATTLISRGERPTLEQVRALVGSGSYSTISKHLDQWRRERRADPAATPPPSLPKGLEQPMEAFWQAAVEQAQRGYAELRSAADATVIEAETQIVAAEAAQQQAEERAERLEQALASLRDDHQALGKRLAVAEDRGRLQTAALVDHEERLTRLQQENAVLQADKAALATELAHAQEQWAAITSRFASLQQEHTQLQTEAENHSRARHQAELQAKAEAERCHRAEADAEARTQALAEVQATLQMRETEVQRLSANSQRAEAEIHALRQATEALRSQQTPLQTENQALQQRLAVMTAEQGTTLALHQQITALIEQLAAGTPVKPTRKRPTRSTQEPVKGA